MLIYTHQYTKINKKYVVLPFQYTYSIPCERGNKYGSKKIKCNDRHRLLEEFYEYTVRKGIIVSPFLQAKNERVYS